MFLQGQANTPTGFDRLPLNFLYIKTNGTSTRKGKMHVVDIKLSDGHVGGGESIKKTALPPKPFGKSRKKKALPPKSFGKSLKKTALPPKPFGKSRKKESLITKTFW